MRRFSFALALWLLFTPALADPAEELARRTRDFDSRGWGTRGHLRASDFAEAEDFLASLEREFGGEELAGPDLLDLVLMRHRLKGLLEEWRLLDLKRRDVRAWLPEAGEIPAPAENQERRPGIIPEFLMKLEDACGNARSALENIDREDARVNEERLERLLKLTDGQKLKFGAQAIKIKTPKITELRRFLSDRKENGAVRSETRARELRWLEYTEYFRWDVGIDEGPAEILQLGKRLYRKTEEDLAAVAQKIDPTRTWREIADDLRLDHPEAEKLLDACRAEMDRAIAFVRKKGFVTVPEWATHVRAEWGGPNDRTPYGHYNPCNPSDPELKGTYVVTPVTRLKGEEREQVLQGNNRAWIRVVSLHEAIPGHHLQFAIAARRKREPPKWFYNPAYVEGWGLYCEELMFRHGYYDDRTRLSQLKMRLWRCARIMIDVGVNFGGMTKEEGIRLLVEGVGMERPSAEMEVVRYIASPGYYSGYIVGRDRFERLLASEKTRLGAEFNERKFHDRLLSFGPIPFSALEEAMRQ
ncbi:MAG: hypothetical protein FD180_2566 [Planctomycetota bacterium]|nr:MAG: hypothetical protein FD180_2566 [Planctomycetota bacterium]